jgi:hypothetical protein
MMATTRWRITCRLVGGDLVIVPVDFADESEALATAEYLRAHLPWIDYSVRADRVAEETICLDLGCGDAVTVAGCIVPRATRS